MMRSEFDFDWSNWAGNHTCKAQYYFEPETEEEIALIIRKANPLRKRIRVVGSGHSFSPIAISNEILISLKNYSRVISNINGIITVQSGIKLHELYKYLKQNNLSLHNYGVINKQSLAGALATGTHGSGANFKSLSAAIEKMKIILHDGTPLVVDRNTKINIEGKEYPVWEAASVSLGLLGVVSEISLKCEPLFFVRSEEHTVSFKEYLENMDDWAKEFDYFKGWWFPHTGKIHVFKTKRITPKEYEFRSDFENYTNEQKKRDAEIDNELSPLFKQSLKEPELIPEINKEALIHYFTDKVKYGAGVDILVHDETVPMVVAEYALSTKNNIHKEALSVFRELIEKKKNNLHFPVDLRYTAAENSWLSPSYNQNSFYIGMCVREYKEKATPDVMQLFIDLMKTFEARPNWGKIFDHSQDELKKLFPKMDDFIQVRKHFDPNGCFFNNSTQEWFS